MLYFILYNSGLELLESLPNHIKTHPAIKNDIRKRKKKLNEVLLDLAVHQSAFNSQEKLNRGRPDIVHLSILQFLFSPLIHPSGVDDTFKKPKLFIHSINNTYFEVLPQWRPPSHYLRFRGLLEQLYTKHTIKISQEEAIFLKSSSLEKLIDKISPNLVLYFTSHGKTDLETLNSLAKTMYNYHVSSESVVCLIGGFQHGSLADSSIKKLVKQKTKIETITLEGGRLPSWKVINIVLQAIEWENTSH